MNNSIIYGLKHPKTNELKYIGKTTNSIKKRLYSHIFEAKKEGKKNKLYSWIKSILNENDKPIIYIIEICSNFVVNDREKYWISYYKLNGFKLKNEQPGGEGQPKGYIFKNRYVPEKNKIPEHFLPYAGKCYGKRSEESIKKMRIAQSGKTNKKLRKKIICKNIKTQVEICFDSIRSASKFFKCTSSQISQRCLGITAGPLNDLFIFKFLYSDYIINTKKQSKTPVFIYENNILIKEFNSSLDAAKFFNINRKTVSYRCNSTKLFKGKKWSFNVY